MKTLFNSFNLYQRQMPILLIILLVTAPHLVRADESKTVPPSWLVDGFVASLEDDRSSIVEQALLFQGSLQLFKVIKLSEHKSVVAHIVQQLDNPDSDVRYAAIEALAALDAKGEASAIAKLLVDPDLKVRGVAIKALTTLDAKDQINAITRFLEDPDSEIRDGAIVALATLDTNDQVSKITKLLMDSEARRAAIRELSALDVKAQASTIAKLLVNPAWNVRNTTDGVLTVIDAKDQGSVVAKLLADLEIRRAAIWALSTLDAESQASAIAEHLVNPAWNVRVAAIEALATLDVKAQASAIAELLVDPDSKVRSAAVRALTAFGAKDQIRAIAKLLVDPDSKVRGAAAKALAALDAKNKIRTIGWLLADPHSKVRSTAIEALATLGAKNKIRAIAWLLEDPDPKVRSSALEALAVLNAKNKIRVIGKLLVDPDSKVRITAIEAIAVLDAKGQISVVANLLTDPDSKVQRAAIKALAALDATDQARTIVKLLAYPEESIGQATIDKLTVLNTKDKLRAIAKLLGDPNPEVWNAGLEALITLGPFAFDNPASVQFLELAYQGPKEAAKFLFMAHLIGAGKDENEIAVSWLGVTGQSPKSEGKIDVKARNEILNVFNKIWPLTKLKSSFREDLAIKSADLVNSSNWQADDIQILVLLEDKLRKNQYTIQADSVQRQAVAIQGKADAIQRKIEKQRVLDWGLFGGKVLLAHALFWLLLISAYPRYPIIRAMFFWNPKVRRIIGMGYVGLLLTWVPSLRSKLFAPFRSPLLEDAMLDEFEGSAYFAGYGVKLLPGGESELISRAFHDIEGQIILQGDSGRGKTMLLRELTLHSNRIVVFLPAVKCAQGVLAAIQKKLQDSATDERFLRNLIYAGAIDIYIDDFNEVSLATRAKISSFVEEYCKANIIIATQALEWGFPKTARSYEIEPLSRDQIEAFLISRKIILTAGVPVSGDAYEAACHTYLATYFDQSEGMIKATQKVLSNPMELTTVAHMLSLGKRPDLLSLQKQSYKIMANDYKHSNIGDDFPLQRFSERVYQMRLEDETVLPAQDYKQEIICLERHKMVISHSVNNHSDEKQFRFRHDKIMDFFIVQTFLGKASDKPQKHLGDSRFRGVYFMLATLMPLADAKILREQLIDFAVDTKDHTVSDSFIEIVRLRKEDFDDFGYLGVSVK